MKHGMKHATDPVAFAACACIASAATGASAALTSMPWWAVLLTGAMLAACSLREITDRSRKSRSVAASVFGAAFALALPTSAPPAPGVVSTSAVAVVMRGDLFDELGKLDSDPNAVLGTTISVTGAWTPATHDSLATISRRIVSCCAADAIDVGFDVRLERDEHIGAGEWVQIEGIVGERVVDGDVRYVLEHSVIRVLEDDATTPR